MKALIAKHSNQPLVLPHWHCVFYRDYLNRPWFTKLFGWSGGYGLEGTGQWMASIGLTPGYLMALMAGSSEFFGGLFLLLGLLTRPTALVLSFTMIIAIFQYT